MSKPLLDGEAQQGLRERVEMSQVRERASHELRCSAELVLLMTRWNASDEKYEALRAAIGFEPRPSDRLVSNDCDCKRETRRLHGNRARWRNVEGSRTGKRWPTRRWQPCSSPPRGGPPARRRCTRPRGTRSPLSPPPGSWASWRRAWRTRSADSRAPGNPTLPRWRPTMATTTSSSLLERHLQNKTFSLSSKCSRDVTNLVSRLDRGSCGYPRSALQRTNRAASRHAAMIHPGAAILLSRLVN